MSKTMRSTPRRDARTDLQRRPRDRRGLTIPEVLAVVLLVAVVVLIGALSVGRGKAAADELACQDNMRAVHSALQTYWTKNDRSYPADQTAFESWLDSPVYFEEEPSCPLDDDDVYHYFYSYNPATDPGPEGITITCPVPESGHGSIPTADGGW
jgi:prepilin-type N-terminal cleavage/methylation domain-containing protein